MSLLSLFRSSIPGSESGLKFGLDFGLELAWNQDLNQAQKISATHHFFSAVTSLVLSSPDIIFDISDSRRVSVSKVEISLDV